MRNRILHNLCMVECERGQSGEGEPLGLGGIVLTLHRDGASMRDL